MMQVVAIKQCDVYEVHHTFEHKYYTEILCVLYWTQKMINASIRNELESWKDGC